MHHRQGHFDRAASSRGMSYSSLMADFSHYSIIPLSSFFAWAANGKQFTDDMFCEALGLMNPPPLEGDQMARLINELDPKAPRRRGRPLNGAVSRLRLADEIDRLPPCEEQSAFRKLLVARLRSGRRWTEFHRSLRFHKAHSRVNRASMMRGLYKDLYDLVSSSAFVEHHILGRLEVPAEAQRKSRSERALALTQMVMGEVLRLHPPSLGTMRNQVGI
jgi:hypothetical protein